jgi:hypothetical protein
MTDTLIDHVAQEIYSEARTVGLVRPSWLNAASDEQDAWRMVAERAIAATTSAKSAIRVPKAAKGAR